MVTMGQVAARARVSQSTVSRVLSSDTDDSKISLQTQKRVQLAVKELGYQRNRIARAMVTGRSRMIGLVTYMRNEENIVQVLAGATEEANAHDYLLKIIQLPTYDVDNDI